MTFKVIANPWASIDAQARPTGRVPLVSDDGQSVKPGRFVGAKLVATQTAERKTRKIGRYFEVTQDAAFDRAWEFSSAPVDVPGFAGRPAPYYLEQLREGSLIPADEACAVACGVKFVSPADVIAKTKTTRRAEYDSQHGAGAFDALQPQLPPVPETQKSPATPKRAASKE